MRIEVGTLAEASGAGTSGGNCPMSFCSGRSGRRMHLLASNHMQIYTSLLSIT